MRLIFWFAALAAVLPLSAAAEEATLPAGCRVLDASAVIRVLVCADPMQEADLVAAGRAACGAARPCGAWVWTDVANAPQTAPANHDGLSQAQVVSSLGVWVAEDEAFVSIEAVRN